jgi:hypothetical protein
MSQRAAQSAHRPTTITGRPMRAAALTLAAWALVCLTGCGQPEVVELARKPSETTQTKERASAERRPRREPTRRVRTPAPTPTPEVELEPVEISAANMHGDNGQADGAGGWVLTANGALAVDNVKLEYPIRAIALELRGDPAHDIWPEFDVNMYNRTVKKNYFPWPRDYATSTVYHIVRRPIDPPLLPGEYLVTFRYYNNSALPEGSTEDRNIALRRIILYP